MYLGLWITFRSQQCPRGISLSLSLCPFFTASPPSSCVDPGRSLPAAKLHDIYSLGGSDRRFGIQRCVRAMRHSSLKGPSSGVATPSICKFFFLPIRLLKRCCRPPGGGRNRISFGGCRFGKQSGAIKKKRKKERGQRREDKPRSNHTYSHTSRDRTYPHYEIQWRDPEDCSAQLLALWPCWLRVVQLSSFLRRRCVLRRQGTDCAS